MVLVDTEVGLNASQFLAVIVSHQLCSIVNNAPDKALAEY